jgi:hypothetical protein
MDSEHACTGGRLERDIIGAGLPGKRDKPGKAERRAELLKFHLMLGSIGLGWQ